MYNLKINSEDRDVEVILNFTSKGEKFTVVRETATEEKGYWVLDKYARTVDSRFFRRNIESFGSIMNYIRSKSFDYGCYNDAELLKSKELLVIKEKQPGYVPEHELGVSQGVSQGAYAEDAGIYGWDLD